MPEKDLKLKAKAEGFDEAAQEADKVTKSTKSLTESVKEFGAATNQISGDVAGTTSNVARMGGAVGRLIVDLVKIKFILGGLRGARGVFDQIRLALVKLAPAAKVVVNGLAQIAKGFKVMVPLLAVILVASRSILRTVRDEVKERERLLDLAKAQARLADAAEQKQLGQKASLERAAGGRRIGGFADAATASGVQAQAARAAAQFTQLEPGDINAAFGTFGDIEGLSQRDLTDLAIAASQGKLGDVNGNESRGGLLAKAKGIIRRNRAGIDTFRKRESQQGDGLGDAAFRPGVTEREQRVAFGTAGNTAQREELLKLLPAGAEESGLLDQAIEFRRLFGSQKEFNDAIVKIASPRGGTAALNRFFGKVEVGLPDQPGFFNRALEKVGATGTFKKLRTEDAEAISAAFRALDRQGGLPGERGIVDPVADTADRLAQPFRKATEDAINLTVNVITNQHNGKYRGVGANGNRKRSRREIIE